MATLIREDRYIKADVDNNNNKFWYIKEYNDCSVVTEWGRVGSSSQSKTKTFGSQSSATDFYDSKCLEKQRDGRNGEIAYRKLNIVADSSGVTTKTATKSLGQNELEKLAVNQIQSGSGSDTVNKLLKYLAKVNVHNILSSTTMTFNDATGLFSTPCGIVTQDSIDKANDLLVNISDLVIARDYSSRTIKGFTGDYLMLVPQDIGRKLEVEQVFPDLQAIQRQKAILDSLQASLDTMASGAKAKSTASSQPEEKVFSVKLNLIEEPKTFRRIEDKFRQTLHSHHSCSHLKPKRVFSVEIDNMKRGFQTGSKVGNINEYWHGTRASNLLSILKGGLIIPPTNASNVTGRMFGNGVYFSSESTKSLNYSYGYWGGGSKDNNCFMFLADVAMGKFYVPRSSGERLPVPGYHSTWAKASQSGVANHEMIVYNINQCNLTYLVEFAG